MFLQSSVFIRARDAIYSRCSPPVCEIIDIINISSKIGLLDVCFKSFTERLSRVQMRDLFSIAFQIALYSVSIVNVVSHLRPHAFPFRMISPSYQWRCESVMWRCVAAIVCQRYTLEHASKYTSQL